MPKADIELAVLKCQNKSKLTLEELVGLLDMTSSDLASEYNLDMSQLNDVKLWAKQEAYRIIGNDVSYRQASKEE